MRRRSGAAGAVKFAYLRDRLFLLSLALYALNRLVLRDHLHSHFLKAHFDDLLLIPCALPVVLSLHRALRLRQHERPPTIFETVSHTAIWAVMSEFLGPLLHLNYADPYDVLCYAAGALLAWVWWNRSRLFPRAATVRP